MKFWKEHAKENRLLMEMSFSEETIELFQEIDIQHVKHCDDNMRRIGIWTIVGKSKLNKKDVFFEIEFPIKEMTKILPWCHFFVSDVELTSNHFENDYGIGKFVELNDVEREFIKNFVFEQYVV